MCVEGYNRANAAKPDKPSAPSGAELRAALRRRALN